MNIAYISADFGVHIFGYKGASIHAREMIRAFRKAGHRVHVISSAMTDGKKKKLDARPEDFRQFEAYRALMADTGQNGHAGELCFYPATPSEELLSFIRALEQLDRFIGGKTRIRQEIRNLLFNLDLYQTALTVFREQAIDFVYERYSLFSLAGIRLARELGVAHLLEVNAPLAYEQEKMRGLEMKDLARSLEAQIFRETDGLLVVSNTLAEYARECGVPDERITVLPNGVDVQVFSDDLSGEPVRQQFGLAGKAIIGFVGSLKPWHGTESLLQAFGRLHRDFPQAHLLIVGDGPMRGTLETMADEQGFADRVTFTGKVQYRDIPQFIAAMDIATAPYIPHENFYFSPIKIFEYMAVGKPVVAGGIGQVNDIVAHGENGLLYEPGNVEQLAEALSTLLADAELRRTMGRRGREWVARERTWDRNAAKVLELAQQLAAAKQAAVPS